MMDIIGFIIKIIRYLIYDLTHMGPVFKAVIFPGLTFVFILAIILVWLERKMAAKVQMRIGPLYAGGPEGILQPIADFIKFAFKELIIPDQADKLLFIALPIASLIVAIAPVAFLPYSPQMVIAPNKLGFLLAMAFVTLFPLIILLTGWASNSKYAFIGGIRAAYQQIGYEIPMWFSALGVALAAKSFDLVEIVEAQQPLWFAVTQPIGALVFFIAMVAEMGRIPFDLPEAEQEIAAGWFVEYSGIMFGLYMVSAMLLKLYVLSLLFTVIYLGGWLPGWGSPEVWTFVKAFIVMFLIMFFRAVFPRTRIKTFINMAWTKLLPLSVINLFIVFMLTFAGFYGGV